MIDRHYGHLARDGREHAVALLDSLAADETAWTPVDVERKAAKPLRQSVCAPGAGSA